MHYLTDYISAKELVRDTKKPLTLRDSNRILDGAIDCIEDIQSMVDSLPYAVAWIDKNLKIVGINKAFSTKFSHFFKSFIIGRVLNDITMPTLRRRLVRDCKTVIQTGEPIVNDEVNYIDGKGQNEWLARSIFPINSNGVRNGAILIYEDISYMFELESSTNNQMSVRDVFNDYLEEQIFTIMAYSLSKDNPILYMSKNADKNIGVTPSTFVEKGARWIDIIVDEDRQRFLKHFQSILERDSKKVICYYRINDEHGSMRWVKQISKIVNFSNGEPRYILSRIEDATGKTAVLDATKTLTPNGLIKTTATDNEGMQNTIVTEEKINQTINRQVLDEILAEFSQFVDIDVIYRNNIIIGDDNMVSYASRDSLRYLGIDIDNFIDFTKTAYKDFLRGDVEKEILMKNNHTAKVLYIGFYNVLIAILVIKENKMKCYNRDTAVKFIKVTFKNLFKIYSKDIEFLNKLDEIKDEKKILLASLDTHQVVSQIISVFYSSYDYNAGLISALSLIANCLNIERIRIFKCVGNKVNLISKYAKSIEYDIGDKDDWYDDEYLIYYRTARLQYFSDKRRMSKYVDMDAINSGGKSVFSTLHYAVKVKDEIKYIICFDEMDRDREWSKENTLLVENICSILSALVINQNNMNSVIQVQRTFETILNGLSQLIYVVDTKNYDVLFVNQTLRKLVKKIDLNKTCYQNFCGVNKMCDDCPINRYLKTGGKSFSYEFYNEKVNRWFLMIANKITWSEERDAIMVTSLDITASKQIEEKEEDMMYIDQLTGLNNHSKYLRDGNEFLARNGLAGNNVAFMMIDVVGMRRINEEIGYVYGNELLTKMGGVLKSITGEETFLARLMEDDFLIMYPYKDNNELNNFIKKVFDSLSKLTISGISKKVVSFVAGISIYKKDGDNIDTLYKNALMSQAYAKENKNISYKFYDQVVVDTIEKMENFKKEIMNAFRNKEFTVYFQPKLDLKTNRIVGVESLIRWIHPQRGVINAGGFIETMDKLNIGEEVENFILEESIKSLKMFNQTEKASNLKLSFNVSAKQFYRYDFYDKLTSVMNANKINPCNLEIELTEGIILQHTEYSVDLMNRLRRLGVKISIDDFGTGYSSLSYLKNLNADIVKIDKVFLQNVLWDIKSRSIATSIINLAKMLDYTVLIEGVENADECVFAKNAGCDLVQGFYIGEALSFNDLLERL